MSIIPGPENKYFERITSVRPSIHQREKHRLQLENALFKQAKPNKQAIPQIKGSKLHAYLKQICVRETQAKMRNLELLRDVECLQISMQQFRPNLFALRQQKAEFSPKMERFMDQMKIKQKSKLKSVQSHCEEKSFSHKADDFTDACSVISPGRQTSRAADCATGITSALSDQAVRGSPNRSLSSCKRLPSGPLEDFTVGRKDAGGADRAHLSDDILDPKHSPDGRHPTDRYGKTSAALQFAKTATESFEIDYAQEPKPQMTLKSPKKNLTQGSSNDSIQNPSAPLVNLAEIAPQTSLMENPRRGFSCSTPQTSSARKSEDLSGRESLKSSFDEQLSESTESHLSISITQSDSGDDELDDEAIAGNNESEEKWHGTISIFKKTPQILSINGFFKLLDSIEDRLHGEQTRVYGNISIDERELTRIISLCESEAGLNEEDLEACGAVVLHELQRLSIGTEKGCLLSAELVSAHQSNTEHMAASLPPDAARLWDRWFKHALLLKESRVLSAERLVELFAPLLERRATYHHQAKVLLRTLLSRSSEECPSADEESDSTCSSGPPSRPAHGGDGKHAVRIQKQEIQELQSAEEESHDESPVKSVPIRETKAYQLLKLSAMQERPQSSEEEEEGEVNEPSGINHGSEVDSGRAKRSSHQDPYPRKEMMNPKIYSALRSKELWEESDDSNSDIEAALRPQPFDTNDDDTDDFYG